MKQSKILMGIAFVFAMSAAFAFKPAAQTNFTARFKLEGSACNAIETSECDGPSTNVLCTNIYANKTPLQQCQGPTYRTVNP